LRIEQTRCIEDDHLRFVSRMDANDAIARGLRLWADDAELLADDAVEERRLSSVRLSCNGDDPGAHHSGKLNAKKEKPLSVTTGAFHRDAGDGLLSRALSGGVPSALPGLTAVFGMGTGVAPAL